MQYGYIYLGRVQYGFENIVQYGPFWFSMMQYSLILYGSVHCDMVCMVQYRVRYGLVWDQPVPWLAQSGRQARILPPFGGIDSATLFNNRALLNINLKLSIG